MKAPSTSCTYDSHFSTLKAWNEAWCQDLEIPQQVNCDSDKPTNDPVTSVSTNNPLTLARLWIKHQRTALIQDKQLLNRFLFFLLLSKRMNGPENSSSSSSSSSSQSQQQVNNGSEQSEVTRRANIKQIEWQLVLLLELYVRLEESILLGQFVKVLDKTPDKRKRKRKRKSNLLLSQQRSTVLEHQRPVFTEYCAQQLTRVVFLLSSKEPLADYLRTHILTKYMWKRIPTIVSHLFHTFEIQNPYLPKAINESENDTLTKLDPLPPKRKRPKLLNDSHPTPVVRKLPPKPSRVLVNHFHGMLNDVEKMLENKVTPFTATTKLSVTRQDRGKIHKSPPGGVKPNKHVRPVHKTRTVLAHATTKASKIDSQNPATLNNASSNVAPSNNQLKSENRVYPSICQSPNRLKDDTSINNNTIFHSPMPQTLKVAETPLSKHKDHIAETPTRPMSSLPFPTSIDGGYKIREVLETPCSDDRTHARLLFSPDNNELFGEMDRPSMPEEKDREETKSNVVVKPTNLFAMVSSKKQKARANSASNSRGNKKMSSTMEGTRLSTTSATVAAAMSFLQRRNSQREELAK